MLKLLTNECTSLIDKIYEMLMFINCKKHFKH